MASSTVTLLAKRIKDEFNIDVDPEKFYRTYVGKHQRAAGECTWIMYTKGDYPFVVGGFEPINKYIVKRNQLSISNEHFRGYELYVTCPGEYGYKENIENEGNISE